MLVLAQRMPALAPDCWPAVASGWFSHRKALLVGVVDWQRGLTGSPLCRTKIEKEKKEHAKLHGMIRTEISGAEIAEEMEKERRFFQLQMCEVRGSVGYSVSANVCKNSSLVCRICCKR